MNSSGHLDNPRICEVNRKGRRMQRGANWINYSLSQSLPIKRRCSLLTCVSKQMFEMDVSFLHCFSEDLRERKLSALQGVAEICFWVFRFQFPSLIESWCPLEELPSPVWSALATVSRWHAMWARSIRYFLLSRKIKRPDVIGIIPSNSHNLPGWLRFRNSCTSCFPASETTCPAIYKSYLHT